MGFGVQCCSFFHAYNLSKAYDSEQAHVLTCHLSLFFINTTHMPKISVESSMFVLAQ